MPCPYFCGQGSSVSRAADATLSLGRTEDRVVGRILLRAIQGDDMPIASLEHHRHPFTHPSSRGLRRPHLSPREVEVLLSWLRCDSKNVVAADLFLSIGTVNTHLARIRAKYRDVGRSAPTKAALVARAVQDGLIELHEL